MTSRSSSTIDEAARLGRIRLAAPRRTRRTSLGEDERRHRREDRAVGDAGVPPRIARSERRARRREPFARRTDRRGRPAPRARPRAPTSARSGRASTGRCPSQRRLPPHRPRTPLRPARLERGGAPALPTVGEALRPAVGPRRRGGWKATKARNTSRSKSSAMRSAAFPRPRCIRSRAAAADLADPVELQQREQHQEHGHRRGGDDEHAAIPAVTPSAMVRSSHLSGHCDQCSTRLTARAASFTSLTNSFPALED